jgi:hypothetical protein
MDINKKNLLSLPVIKNLFHNETVYDTLYIVPTRKKHKDSGYTIIAVVGVKSNQDMEICAFCDDIYFMYREPVAPGTQSLRIDCEYPSGIFHIWSWYHSFKVYGLSSVTVEVIEDIKKRQGNT